MSLAPPRFRISILLPLLTTLSLNWNGAPAVAADRYGSGSRVVFSADGAPGLAAGESVTELGYFAVGDDGSVLVAGSVGSAQAVWFGAPDAIEMIYRDDQPVPGFESRGDVGDLVMARMSRNGNFLVFLTGGSDTSRIWIRAGGVTALADARPAGFFRQVSIANDGELIAAVAQNYYDFVTLYSVRRGVAGQLLRFVDEQLLIPGFSVEIRYAVQDVVLGEGAASPRSVDRNGRYLALLGLASRAYKAAAWTDCCALYQHGGEAGSGVIIYGGQEAIGAPPGARFVDYGFDQSARLGRASVNENGQVVFQWETELDGAVWTGLWTHHQDRVELVVGEGDPIANRPGDGVRPHTDRTEVPGGSQEARLWNLPQSDRDGAIVFPGEILASGNPAIFRHSEGAVRVLAEAGHAFEDGSAFSWESAPAAPAVESPFLAPYLNAVGQVLLWANARDESGGPLGLSPWILDRSGTATPVVLPGDRVGFGAGDERAVAPQAHHDAATDAWYGGSILSDSGHVLTLARSDSGWGIVYTEPPESAAAVPVAVAGQGLGVTFLPHPFPGRGVMQLRSKSPEPVSISIYDAAGRLVRRIEADLDAGGNAAVRWDGRGHNGFDVASGVYFVNVEQGTVSAVRKLVLVR